MKKVYFVRHGETTSNASGHAQDSETKLSEKGKSQAESLAERFKNLEVDKVICSDYIRAKETAEIINRSLKKEIEYTSDLIENRSPSILRGRHFTDPEAQAIRKIVKDNFHVADFHHSDEENFSDIKSRAIKVLQYLKELEEEKILVVSHNGFIKAIVSVILLGEEITSHEYERLIEAYYSWNTGLTICVFQGEPYNSWRLETWNDIAHLGE